MIPSRWDWRPKLRWFAAEYLIVVLGVLTAVGINAWWQGRQDAAGERSYLTLIDRDLHQMEANLQQLVDYEAQQFQGGLRVYRILSAPARSDEEQALASESLSHLLSRRTMNPTDATYQDLLSTGSLRLLRNRALRDRLVAFYEEAERTFDIHNRNNAVFVDDLFAHEMLGRGLLYGRAGSGLGLRSAADSALSAELSPGYADGRDPLWRLPAGAPEWAVLRSTLIQRIRIAAYARQYGAELLDETRQLRHAIQAELDR